MIPVRKSPNADTRTSDFTRVSKKELLDSSVSHIQDVQRGLLFFQQKIGGAAVRHDADKLTDIDGFYADFQTGFDRTVWWDRHRRIHRHHLNEEDGVPDDVNLVDIIEYITDCVMAGSARAGQVHPLKTDVALLSRAFQNTVELLKSQVVIVEDDATDEKAEEVAENLGELTLREALYGLT